MIKKIIVYEQYICNVKIYCPLLKSGEMASAVPKYGLFREILFLQNTFW